MIEAINYITIVGFVGQGLFFSRFLFQLILSEKSKKIITPTIFWKLSLLASIIFFIYGYLREDFAIMLGQSITYFIYIRNLQLQGEWKKLPLPVQILLFIFPVLIGFFAFNSGIDPQVFFASENIPKWLLTLGIIAQLVFIFRFIFQWISSEKHKKSHLPLGFWIISLIGSSLILSYAIFREDPVLFLAHSIGMIVYARNIFLWKKERNNEA
ncbi:putative transport-related, membrane protein [unidentified eubacterium SCB49]|nr:putative transport-related, membrane protein [unidentified eubacterium SCB49]